jgi:hypothetical protein
MTRSLIYKPQLHILAHLSNGPNFGGVTNEGFNNNKIFIYFAGGYVMPMVQAKYLAQNKFGNTIPY